MLQFAALPDGGHLRNARPVGEIGVRRGVEHDQVGAGAEPQMPTSSRRSARAPPAVAAQTASCVVMRMSLTASAMQNGMLEVKHEPGLQSVASATVAPAPSSRRASGYGCLVENSTPGSSVATVADAGERVDVGIRQVGAVVGRRGLRLDRDLHTGAVAELVGVHPRLEPGGAPGREDGPGLVGVERAPLAEHVDPPGVRRARAQHRAADQVDVPGRVRRTPAATTWAPR